MTNGISNVIEMPLLSVYTVGGAIGGSVLHAAAGADLQIDRDLESVANPKQLSLIQCHCVRCVSIVLFDNLFVKTGFVKFNSTGNLGTLSTYIPALCRYYTMRALDFFICCEGNSR